MFAWRHCVTHWTLKFPSLTYLWCVHNVRAFIHSKGKLWVPLLHDSISRAQCNKRQPTCWTDSPQPSTVQRVGDPAAAGRSGPFPILIPLASVGSFQPSRIVSIAVALRGHSEWQPGGIVLPR